MNKAGIKPDAKHVCFEGFDIPKGKAQIKFIRSIPIEKALDSTIIAYEMNGEPLPLEHGVPLRALALGNHEQVPVGMTPIRGVAYAGEDGVKQVEVSIDNGQTWNPAKLIGLEEPYAWRHWAYLWDTSQKGAATILSRATSTSGERQPNAATWNVLGYCNNGIQEHGVTIQVI